MKRTLYADEFIGNAAVFIKKTAAFFMPWSAETMFSPHKKPSLLLFGLLYAGRDFCCRLACQFCAGGEAISL